VSWGGGGGGGYFAAVSELHATELSPEAGLFKIYVAEDPFLSEWSLRQDRSVWMDFGSGHGIPGLCLQYTMRQRGVHGVPFFHIEQCKAYHEAAEDILKWADTQRICDKSAHTMLNMDGLVFLRTPRGRTVTHVFTYDSLFSEDLTEDMAGMLNHCRTVVVPPALYPN